MAWLKSSISAVSIFLLLFAEIFDSRRMLGIFLFWLGQIPLSFMWWSTLQWGGSVTMIRVLGSNDLPVDIYEWKQMTSFADEAKDLKKNRIKFLKALKLIRFHSEIYQLTILGRFVSCSFKLLGSQR